MEQWILSITDLNEYVRKTLAADPMLHGIRIRGEISNFKRAAAGHWYFTLKDEFSRINCVMFRQSAMTVSMRPTDGMAVILSGSASLYTQGGAYQFYADAMRPDGVGALSAQFEALKARLAAEGLFDAGRKRPLPMLPRRIAMITSPTGAVLHDIRTVSARRNPAVPLVLLPVQVQGEGAAEQIARAIREAGKLPGVDVIITGRGGGSMEDLWAFNEECVVRAIVASPVPVISAVGHETDVTLADFAADVRAATPSMAAELAVQDREELRRTLMSARRQLTNRMSSVIGEMERRLSCLLTRLTACHPATRVSEYERRLTLLRGRLDKVAAFELGAAELRLTKARARLESIGPMQVLRRGYALAMVGRKPVQTAEEARRARVMRLMFQDGSVPVCVMDAAKEEQLGNEEKTDL